MVQKAFVDRPTIPLESISAMFNMDMVGRLNAERTILVSGVGTSKEWGAFLDNAIPSDIKMNRSESGLDPVIILLFI